MLSSPAPKMESSPTFFGDAGPTPSPTSPPEYSPTLLVPTSPPDAQPTRSPCRQRSPTEYPVLTSPGPPPTAPPSSDEAEVTQVSEVAEAAEAAARGLFDASQMTEAAEAAMMAEVAEAAQEAARGLFDAAEAAAEAEAEERTRDRIERLAAANDLMREALAETADTVAAVEWRQALLHAADRLLKEDTGASPARPPSRPIKVHPLDEHVFVEYLWDPRDYDWEEGIVRHEYDSDFSDPQRKRKRDAKTTRHTRDKKKNQG